MAFTNIKTAEQKAQEAAEQAIATTEASRRSAYAAESDPLFFKYQRGSATEQQWLDAVAEIKTRYPYPEA